VLYSHVGDDKGRTHELEKNAIKCMRGLLFCYMRQSDKVRSSNLSSMAGRTVELPAIGSCLYS